jgi:hypothetical protein
LADWIPSTLEYFDDLFGRPIFSQIRQGLSLRPSDYWKRQCQVGASFLVHKEAELRHEIGVERILWGFDSPHAEGTWPHTREKLAEAFSGVSHDEVAQMVGGNAARIYGFDPERLAPLVARIGPELVDLSGGPG